MKISIQLPTSVLVGTIIALMFFINSALLASAQTPEIELEGYAWSSNIGWISLNCKSGGNDGGDAGNTADDVCSTSNYKVVINPDKTITGYAWSSNIGWVRFGGLSSFPNGTGNVQSNAAVTGTYPNYTFQGWARACAGTASGANACSNMAINPESGSWDGWISLKGTYHQLRMVNGALVKNDLTSTTDIDGFAWGSTVVGWIDMFTRASAVVTRSDIAVTGFDQTGTPTKTDVVNDVRFNATVTGVPVGTSVDYELSSGGVTKTGTYRDGVFNPTLELDGLAYGTNLTAQLKIDLPAPGDVVESATVNGPEETTGNTRTTPDFNLEPVPPTITLVVPEQNNQTSVTIRQGETVDLEWEITSVLDVTCTAEGNISGNPTITHSGDGTATPTTSSGTFSTNALTSRSEVEIVCTSAAAPVTRTVTIDMIPNVQEI